jgi:hypothetical protein
MPKNLPRPRMIILGVEVGWAGGPIHLGPSPAEVVEVECSGGPIHLGPSPEAQLNSVAARSHHGLRGHSVHCRFYKTGTVKETLDLKGEGRRLQQSRAHS